MRKKSFLALKLAIVSCAMFGFGFLLVPIYDIVCELTGLNGKTGVISEAELASPRNDSAAESRLLEMEFLAHVDPAMNFEFRPQREQLQLETGAMHTIYYLAKNNSDRDMTVQATPSLVPARAAAYLKKLECFCFEKQFLAAGEERKLPARIVVSRDLPPDLNHLTMNYTLFAVKNKG